MITHWWVLARWAVRRVGYWIRPYDILADARRWWWQPRRRCGFSLGWNVPYSGSRENPDA